MYLFKTKPNVHCGEETSQYQIFPVAWKRTRGQAGQPPARNCGRRCRYQKEVVGTTVLVTYDLNGSVQTTVIALFYL